MIAREDFVRGLLRLLVACGRAGDDAIAEVYFEALEPQTTGEEWEEFTRQAVASGRWRFFPSVAEVLDAMREQRGGRSLEAEAVEAYQRVLESGVYASQAGLLWSSRGVREQCGRAAMEAFLAAGAHSAFASSWDESKRRERFIREYSNVVRDDPSTRLLPAAGEAPKALPGPAGYEPLTAAEAHNILRKIEDRVPAHQSRMNDETLRERVAFLRAQATELTAETETAQEGPPGPPIAAAQERVPRARGQTSWMHARTARPGRNGEA